MPTLILAPAAIVIKIYWGRIRGFFTGLFSRGRKMEEDENKDA
jgi:hypothetical protein